jgi:hypothetical protein
MLFDLAQHLGSRFFHFSTRAKKLAPGQIHGVGNGFSVKSTRPNFAANQVKTEMKTKL